MKVNDFYNEVAKLADTEGTKINVAETRRVLSVAFQLLSKMETAEALDLVAKGIGSAAKKKASS